MTNEQTNDYQRFLAIAAKEAIKIIGKGHVKATGQACYSVSSSKGKSAYIVTVAGASLVCECKAKGYCKHRALVRHEMILAADKARQLAQEAHEAQEREMVALEREQEIDRALFEAEHASDVYDAYDDEPIIMRNGPTMPFLPERVREAM
jgi:hypothetical protein